MTVFPGSTQVVMPSLPAAITDDHLKFVTDSWPGHIWKHVIINSID